MVAKWGFISDQKNHSHCVSWCYIQLLRAEYIKKLEKMAMVPGLRLRKDNVEIKEKLEELDGNTKNLEEKAEELLIEIEKARETYKCGIFFNNSG